MTWMRKGDESCNSNAIAKSNLAGNNCRRDLRIIRRRIRGCTGSTIDDRRSRVLQHSRHLVAKGAALRASVLAG